MFSPKVFHFLFNVYYVDDIAQLYHEATIISNFLLHQLRKVELSSLYWLLLFFLESE